MLIRNSPDKMKRKLILPAINTLVTPLPLRSGNFSDLIPGLAHRYATSATHTQISFIIICVTIIYSLYLVIAREMGKSPDVEETG